MLELLQLVSLLTSTLLFMAVITKGQMDTKGIDIYYPDFYSPVAKLCTTISNIAHPLASVVILIGGITTLALEIYAMFLGVTLCLIILMIMAKKQRCGLWDVQVSKNQWIDIILLQPLALGFFFGCVVLCPLVAFNI